MKRCLVSLAILAVMLVGMALPFAIPVYAITQDRIANGEGDEIQGMYVGTGSWNDITSNDDGSSYLQFNGVPPGVFYHCWNFQDFSEPNTGINSVTVTTRNWGDAGQTIRSYCRIDGIDYNHTTGHTITSTWTTYTATWNTNPATGAAWTASDISNAQFGVMAVVSSSMVARLSYIKITVDYNPSALPTLTTSVASSILCTSAMLNGNITSTGGATPDYYGFVWKAISDGGDPGDVDPSTNPGSWTGWKSSSGSYGIGSYNHNIDTLTKGQTYYFRFAAHNSAGWVYSSALYFVCHHDPVIITQSATIITVTTARLQSYLDDNGGENCEVRWGYGLSDEGNNIEDYDTFTAFVGSYPIGASPYLDVYGLAANADYYFNVEVRNNCGVDTGASTLFHTESSVGSPSNVIALPGVDNVVLSWTKGTGASNTFIRYKANTCPVDETDGTLIYLGIASTYTHTGLISGTDYCYYIVGYDSIEGYSANYVVIHATTLAAGIVPVTPSTAIAKPSGMTQTPSISSALEENIPIMPYVRATSTSTGIPMGTVLYFILLIVLTGLSYYIYRHNNSIEWVVVIWFFANWIAYPTLHTPLAVPIFISLVGLGYGAYRMRSLI